MTRLAIVILLTLSLFGCYSPCTDSTRVPKDAYSASLTVTDSEHEVVAAAVTVGCSKDHILALTATHVMHGDKVDRFIGPQKLFTVKKHPVADLSLIAAPRGSEACSAACLGKPALIGDEVWVVGSALGVPKTVSKGVVVAVLEDDLDGARFTVYRTDATVLPGNSGGGMFNADGCLIGIVSFVYMPIPPLAITGTGSAVHTVHITELLSGVL